MGSKGQRLESPHDRIKIPFLEFVSVITLVPYTLVVFLQTFVAVASWDKDELFRLWGQKVKG